MLIYRAKQLKIRDRYMLQGRPKRGQFVLRPI